MDIAFHIPSWLLWAAAGAGGLVLVLLAAFGLLAFFAFSSFHPWR